jgi:hypothetical protein
MTGMAITVWTVRLALLLYLAALFTLLPGGRRRGLARGLWTAGFLAYLAHVAAAFEWVHGWSHGTALAETASQTAAMVGVASGAGLWLNYLFTLVWGADVASWWLRPEQYAGRSLRATLAVHAFLGFMFFNGAVVFATGPSRWIGLLGLGVLAGTGAGWLVARTGIGAGIDSTALDERERRFTERMRGVALIGTFNAEGEPAPPTPERYEIRSVEKVGTDLWRFNADMNCCGVEGALPVTVPLRFAGDTPMIQMTDTTIPGVGTFTVRLFFYANSYAGTWQHDDRRGTMTGRLETTGTPQAD